jgi:hypothetical protein
MVETFKNCQSCGMPLKKDEMGGGTNADGSRSGKYCSHCYEAGRFKSPEMTAAQMQVLVKGKLREMGFPPPLPWLFARSVPKLERWRAN